MKWTYREILDTINDYAGWKRGVLDVLKHSSGLWFFSDECGARFRYGDKGDVVYEPNHFRYQLLQLPIARLKKYLDNLDKHGVRNCRCIIPHISHDIVNKVADAAVDKLMDPECESIPVWLAAAICIIISILGIVAVIIFA